MLSSALISSTIALACLRRLGVLHARSGSSRSPPAAPCPAFACRRTCRASAATCCSVSPAICSRGKFSQQAIGQPVLAGLAAHVDLVDDPPGLQLPDRPDLFLQVLPGFGKIADDRLPAPLARPGSVRIPSSSRTSFSAVVQFFGIDHLGDRYLASAFRAESSSWRSACPRCRAACRPALRPWSTAA